jgi:ABC-type transport system involved in multi-copper enzyme maturation permease subunit
MFLNALEHMARRKLILIVGLLSVLYLVLFWKGIASLDPQSLSIDSGIPASNADMAYAALTIAGSMLSVMVWGLTIVLGASILPDEMDAGRMSIWAALPQSRFRVYASTTLAPLLVSVVFGYILFGLTAVITAFYAPFTPSSIPVFIVSMPIWLSATWAFVILGSMVVGKIPAMLITFILEGFAIGMGNMVELGKSIPELHQSTFYTVARVITFIFPFERGFRSVQMGLLPEATMIDEALAMLGIGGNLPFWEVIYPGIWAGTLFFLGYRLFRRKDL